MTPPALRRGTAAGGAVLPKKNQRNIDPRTPAGPPGTSNKPEPQVTDPECFVSNTRVPLHLNIVRHARGSPLTADGRGGGPKHTRVEEDAGTLIKTLIKPN